MKSELERDYVYKFDHLLESKLGFEILERYERIHLGVNFIPDYYLSIKVGIFSVPVVVEIKGEVTHQSQLKKFLENCTKLDGIKFLVATSIHKNIKDRLKRDSIGFYEVDQEVFVPLGLMLTGNSSGPSSKFIKKKGFRAESYIKTLLYLISKPEALKFTQRELAERLDLSLGGVNNSIKKLEASKVFIKRGGKRFVGDFNDLIDRLRIILRDIELGDHHLGYFSPLDKGFSENWPKKMKEIDSYWSGEAAAFIRTQYLSPEIFSIYTYNDKITPILKKLRLKKDPKGRIEIKKCFWPEEINNKDGTVPDFVTLCELLNSGIDRNKEAAEIIKKKLHDQMRKYEY